MSDNTYVSENKRDYKAQFANKAANAERRRLYYDLKVYDVKIDSSHVSKSDWKLLNRLFAEAKWYYNDCIAFGNQTDDNKPHKNDYKKKSVIRLDKDRNPIEESFNVLTSASKQQINKRIGAACKSIKTNKSRGNIKSSNGLRFRSEVNSVSFRQFGNSWRIASKNRIKIAGFNKPFRMIGMKQLDIDGIEFANSYLINEPDGFHLKITCYVPKQLIEYKRETVGIDFGCQTSLTIYNDSSKQVEKVDVRFSEPKNLKHVQRKLNRRYNKKFSNRSNKGRRLTKSLRKYHQKITNRKNDTSHKIVHDLKQYENIVIQNEMLSKWQKGGHGKVIAHGVLGRVKALLKLLPNVTVLSERLPTSKYCFDCFHKHSG